MSRPQIFHEDVAVPRRDSDGTIYFVHVWEHVCSRCGHLVAETRVGEGTTPVYDECPCTLPVLDEVA